MRIGIDIREAHGQKAGKGVYAYEMMRALAEIDQTNEYVLYDRTHADAETDGGLGFFLPKNFRVRYVSAPSIFWHIAVALRVVFLDRIDLFFAPTSYIIPFLLSRKCIVTVPDVYAFLGQKSHMKKAVVIEKMMARRACAHARRIVTISHFTKQELVRIFHVPESSVTVIQIAARRAPETPAAPTPAISNLPESYILYLGTLEPRKNIKRLVQAFSLFKEHPAHRDIKLVLAGKKGWQYDEIFEEINRLKLASEVVYIGYVGDEEKPELYRRARCFAFPSLYEGFGIPPLEALMYGTPVVTSNTSSLPEVVGDAGILVDPLDTNAIARALSSVVDDPALRERLIAQGKEQAKTFSWQKAARELLQIFTELYTS